MHPAWGMERGTRKGQKHVSDGINGNGNVGNGQV